MRTPSERGSGRRARRLSRGGDRLVRARDRGAGTITVTAYFSDSAGLFTGNDVGVLGVPVGTVTEIEPDGDRVKVTLELDTDHPIPADAGAVVVARSVATDRYVELTPVYHGGPEAGGRRHHLRRLHPDARRLRPGAPDDRRVRDRDRRVEGDHRRDQAVRGRRRRGVLRQGRAAQRDDHASCREAATEVSGQRGDIVATLDSLDSLVAAMAGNEQTVRTFLRRVAQGSALLDDQRTEFRASLRALDRAVTTVAAFAVKNRGPDRQGPRRLGRVMTRADEEAAPARRDPRGDAAGTAEPAPHRRQRPGPDADRPGDHRAAGRAAQPALRRTCPRDLCDLVCGTDPQLPRRAPASRGWW